MKENGIITLNTQQVIATKSLAFIHYTPKHNNISNKINNEPIQDKAKRIRPNVNGFNLLKTRNIDIRPIIL